MSTDPARPVRRDAIVAAALALLSTPLTAGLLSALHLLRRALAPEGLPRPLLAQLRMIPHAIGLGFCVYGLMRAMRAIGGGEGEGVGCGDFDHPRDKRLKLQQRPPSENNNKDWDHIRCV